MPLQQSLSVSAVGLNTHVSAAKCQAPQSAQSSVHDFRQEAMHTTCVMTGDEPPLATSGGHFPPRPE